MQTVLILFYPFYNARWQFILVITPIDNIFHTLPYIFEMLAISYDDKRLVECYTW